MNLKKSWFFIFALILMGLPQVAQADITLKFGVYAADKPTEVVRKFRPVLTALEVALGRYLGESVTIATKVARTYEDALEDVVNGRVDFARFGPASYIKAKSANPAITLLAVECKKGRKVFNGIIAGREEPFRSEIRGHSMSGEFRAQREAQ